MRNNRYISNGVIEHHHCMAKCAWKLFWLCLSFNLTLKSCCRSMIKSLNTCCKCLSISYIHVQWEMSGRHTSSSYSQVRAWFWDIDHQARILPTYGCKSMMNGALHVLLGSITRLYTYSSERPIIKQWVMHATKGKEEGRKFRGKAFLISYGIFLIHNKKQQCHQHEDLVDNSRIITSHHWL